MPTDSWIPFGRITRPHGVRGELRLIPYSLEDELPHTVERVRVAVPRGERILTLTDVRTANNAYLVGFAEIADRDAAATLAGGELSVRVEDLPELEAGEYFLYELLGATLFDEKGTRLGTARGISKVGGQELLVVDTDRGERLLNTIGETLIRFDRQTRSLTVRLMPGVWD